MLNFSQAVQDYFFSKRHVGEWPEGADHVYGACITTADEQTQLQLQVRASAGTIVEARFKALACPYGIACLAYCCDVLHGQPVSALETLDADHLIKALDLPSVRYNMAFLSEDLLQDLFAKIPSISD